jgi:hypothetical protein
MLRRWLAVLRAQQDDPPRPASPASSASASTTLASTTPAADSLPTTPAGSSSDPDPDPDRDWDALTLTVDESGDAARAGADQDASRGVDLGVDPADARDPTRLVFPADAESSSTASSAPGFEPDRETNHDDFLAHAHAHALRFRDVLIRSRALERLVESFARRPASSPVESALLLDLFRETTMDDAVADALGDGLRRASAAVAARDAEVQLRDEDLVGMLVAAAASVKREGEAETLRGAWSRLDAEFHRAVEIVERATKHAREKAAGDDRCSGGPTPGIEPVTSSAPPTAELASATRRALWLARRAFAAASTRREKTRQSARIEPVTSADALRRLRAASETLAAAKRDVAALSEESRARLLEAETFADAKSAELRAKADDARRAHAELDAERAALEARLVELTTRTDAAFHIATHAEEECAAFESSDATVRATLETRVRDLASRGEEYDAEAAAAAATAEAVEAIAAARVRAMANATNAADACESNARARYVAAARAHGEGLAGAARLCLRRLRFCADEAADAGAKLERADQLGLGAEVAADLRAGGRSVVKKYLEAEEGARAVFAAAETTRRDAETVAPGETDFADAEMGAEAEASSESNSSRGALADVFAEIDALRAEFEALERPEMTAWGVESEVEGEEREEEGERTEAEKDGGEDPAAPAAREVEEVEEPSEEPAELAEPEEAPRVPEARPQAHAEAPPEAHPQAHLQAHPEAPPEAHPQAHPEAHPQAHPQAHPETHPETHPEAHPEAHPQAHPQAHPETHPETHPEMHPEATPEDLDDPDTAEGTATWNESEETRTATDDAPIAANDDENDDVDDWLSDDGAKGDATEAADDDDGADGWPDVDAPVVARTADTSASRG